jgi:hypothetical protein
MMLSLLNSQIALWEAIIVYRRVYRSNSAMLTYVVILLCLCALPI